jgi:hypothetical protein
VFSPWPWLLSAWIVFHVAIARAVLRKNTTAGLNRFGKATYIVFAWTVGPFVLLGLLLWHLIVRRHVERR